MQPSTTSDTVLSGDNSVITLTIAIGVVVVVAVIVVAAIIIKKNKKD